MYRGSFALAVCHAAVLSFCLPSFAQVNVLTYHNDNMRTGANLQETILTPANVNPTTFGKLFTYDLDGYVYAQPLYVTALSIPGQGTHNVLFVATEHNSIYALDGDSNAGPTGGVLWQVNLGPSAPTPNSDFGTRYGSFAIVPEVGITGTPVIDVGSATLFVDTFTHESGTYFHRLHALDISTGVERPYSPVTIVAAIPANGAGSTNGVLRFEARQHLQRTALALANGVVYVGYAGYGETDPFHGWLLGYSAANLQPGYVFNSTPNSSIAAFGPNAGEGGIWMGGSGPAVDGAGYLYLATGNGSFNAYNGSNGTEYASSLLKLSSTLAVADYFTPYNQSYLSDNDLDLGAGGIVLLPDQAGPFPRLLVGAGKPGTAYVLSRDLFTADNHHYNSTGVVDTVAQKLTLGGGQMSTPAYFNGTLYSIAAKDALAAFTLTNGMLPNQASAAGPRVFGYPGATPSVSANGDRDGIVWAIDRATPAVLAAYAATNVTEEIYSSSLAGARDRLGPGIKFAVPTVANGKVYVGGQNMLSVFGLFPQSSTNSGSGAIPIGTYNGLFYESSGVDLPSSGSLALTITKNGTYSGRLQIGTTRYAFKGQFDSSGAAANTIARRGTGPLSVNLQVDPANTDRITGTLTDGDWTADLVADRAVFNTRTNPAGLAGRYTVLFPGSTNADGESPQGNSFATLNVSRAGVVACTFALADGSRASQSSSLSQEGQCPLYVSLYRGGGQLIGWLNFTNSDPNALGGETSWIKAAGSGGGYYPSGFEVLLSPGGSTYIPPARGSSMVDFSNGYISLTGDNLGSSITNEVAIAGNRVINLSPDKLSLTLSPSSGLFRGSVLSPDGGRPIPFSGVVLQNRGVGSGYFLFGNQSGRVDLRSQ